MGMSVSAHTYDVKKLKSILSENIKESDAEINASDFLDKVMPVAGAVKDDIFTTVSCDYWNEFDPWGSLIDAIDAYYQISNGYEILKEAEICWVYEGADEYELYEALNLKDYPTHPDDEEEDENE